MSNLKKPLMGLLAIGLLVAAGLFLIGRQSKKIKMDFGTPATAYLLVSCYGSACEQKFSSDKSFVSADACAIDCYRKDIDVSVLQPLADSTFCGFGFTTPDYFVDVIVNGEQSAKFGVVNILSESGSLIRTGLQFAEGLAFPCSSTDKANFDLYLSLSGLQQHFK